MDICFMVHQRFIQDIFYEINEFLIDREQIDTTQLNMME